MPSVLLTLPSPSGKVLNRTLQGYPKLHRRPLRPISLKQQDSVFQLIEVIFEIIELEFVKVGF